MRVISLSIVAPTLKELLDYISESECKIDLNQLKRLIDIVNEELRDAGFYIQVRKTPHWIVGDYILILKKLHRVERAGSSRNLNSYEA